MGVKNGIFKPNSLQKHTKMMTYKTITRPMFVYGCEAWKISGKREKKQQLMK